MRIEAGATTRCELGLFKGEEFLRELEDKYPGLEHIVLHWAEGMPRDEFLEQLRLFSDGVMPHFVGSR